MDRCRCCQSPYLSQKESEDVSGKIIYICMICSATMEEDSTDDDNSEEKPEYPLC